VPVNSAAAGAAPGGFIRKVNCLLCHPPAGIHALLAVYSSFWLCLQPGASDIRVTPPFLSPMTQESLTKETHSPNSGCSLSPITRRSSVRLWILRSPGLCPPFSDHRSHRLLSRDVIKGCYQHALPMSSLSHPCPGSPFPRRPSQGTRPARGVDGACKSSQPRDSPPSSILPKEWPHMSQRALRVVTSKRADAWHGFQLVKCHYPECRAMLSSLTPGFPPAPSLLGCWHGFQPPSWHSSFVPAMSCGEPRVFLLEELLRLGGQEPLSCRVRQAGKRRVSWETYSMELEVRKKPAEKSREKTQPGLRGDQRYFLGRQQRSSSGVPSSRKMRSYWRESSGGLRG